MIQVLDLGILEPDPPRVLENPKTRGCAGLDENK